MGITDLNYGTCPICGKMFTAPWINTLLDIINQHMIVYHGVEMILCEVVQR